MWQCQQKIQFNSQKDFCRLRVILRETKNKNKQKEIFASGQKKSSEAFVGKAEKNEEIKFSLRV
jgi:hypothetical protein